MTTTVFPTDVQMPGLPEVGGPIVPPPNGTGPRRDRGRVGRFWRGRPEEPAWVRPALLTLLAATAALYLVDLSVSGWANSFYSAAVEAGTKSWKAFLFGSFDSSNFITVDKPPASLWVMELSARMFGVNSWSILVPQALEGVATVGLVYATVRRWSSATAGLVAGAVMALTPVAVLMFRYNNPDALLVLLLVGAAYATTRALEKGSTRWLVLAFSLVGFGFLTKMLQAFLVVPVFGLVYLVAAPPSLWRRLRQLVVAGVALVVAAGWWLAIVSLVPAADRPYIGGSSDNSIWNLIFGYNGFGRITGQETGSVGGRAGGGSPWGPTGLFRLFGSEMGTQISWLLPAALVLLVTGLIVTRRAKRTDGTRAALLLWGGWLLVTGAVFSFSQGIIHPYYTVALAPAIAALVGIGGWLLWQHRQSTLARLSASAALALTGWWSFELLRRTPGWNGWLDPVVLAAGLISALVVAGWPWLVGGAARRPVAVLTVALAAVAALAGPLAYALSTVRSPHSGGIPSAGPVSTTAGPGGGPGGPGGAGAPFGGPPGARIGGPAGGSPSGGLGAGLRPSGRFGIGGQGPGGGIGGILNASTSPPALTKALRAGASRFTWVAAAVSANQAAGYQLASEEPVMAIGGFNGTDPAPTLAQFERDVAEHKIHYFISGGGVTGPGGGSGTSTAGSITSWVESHFRAETFGGVTVYDLSTSRR